MKLAKQIGNEALLRCTMESGTQRYVLVRQANDKPFLESIVEFRVPSLRIADMPAGAEYALARLCLDQNNLVATGYWALDGDMQCFAFIANYPGRQFAKMRAAEFRDIIRRMTETVLALEAKKEDVYSQVAGAPPPGESLQRGGEITPRGGGDITLRGGGDITLRGGGDITLRGGGDITLRGGDITPRSNSAGKLTPKLAVPE
jgi:hypothetical protein